MKLVPHFYTEPQHDFQNFVLSRQRKPIGIDAGFQDLTAAVMNVVVSWDIVPCSPDVVRRFGGKYHPHFQV
jgi:hypothetical protein